MLELVAPLRSALWGCRTSHCASSQVASSFQHRRFGTSQTIGLATKRSSPHETAELTSNSLAESSVARGTRFELLCQAVLKEVFGMDLERTGGAGDKGIDLRGWWTPNAPSDLQQQRRIRILAQCKCQDEGGKKMGPVLIREMEGVLHRASSPSFAAEAHDTAFNDAAAGIILSSSGFSKQALLQVRSSVLPLVAIHVLAEQLDPSTNKIQKLSDRCLSIVWNDRFGSRQHGIVGADLELRWERLLDSASQAQGLTGRPIVFRGGKRLH